MQELNTEQRKYIRYVAQRRGRRSLPGWILLTLLIISLIGELVVIWLQLRDSWISTTLQYTYGILAPLTAVNLIFVRWISTTYNIVVKYMALIRRIEEDRNAWGYPEFVRSMNMDLERLANSLARRATTLLTQDPDVVRTAARKAAFVRSLEAWVSMPEGITRWYLLDNLIKSLKLVADKRWYDLREEEPDSRAQITRTQRISYVLLAIILAAGAVALITIYPRNANSIWEVSSLGSTLLAVGSYLSLAKAGLIPGSLQEALDVTQKVMKTN